MGRILLAVALDFFEFRIGEDWRPGLPRLAEWHATMAARPSFKATTPW
jgi:glutathione S-transferase